MSRSFKKTPSQTNSGSSGRASSKRDANKRVRRTKNIPSGGAYRQVYDSWDICDYMTVFADPKRFERYIQSYRETMRFPKYRFQERFYTEEKLQKFILRLTRK